MNQTIIRAKVDDLVKWQNLMEQCKREIDRLKGDFHTLGANEMKDKKVSQVTYYGSNNSKVIVTNSESVAVISHELLKNIIGKIIDDFTKEDTKYKYSEPFKRILKSIKNGTYVEQNMDDVIKQITEDESKRVSLRKKLKGNFEKDVEALKTIAGLNQQDAEHYAYFCNEAANYLKIVQVLEASGYKKGSPDFYDAIVKIKNLVEVDEGIKIGVDSEETSEYGF